MTDGQSKFELVGKKSVRRVELPDEGGQLLVVGKDLDNKAQEERQTLTTLKDQR